MTIFFTTRNGVYLVALKKNRNNLLFSVVFSSLFAKFVITRRQYIMKLFFTSTLTLMLILAVGITLAETSTPTANAAPTPETICADSSTDITTTTHTKLTIATWNVGVFNNGEPPIGMPDDSVEANLPKIKSLITSFEADILIITEYASFLNQGKSRNTYDEVLKQFYPYTHYTRDAWTAIFSKYPFSVELITSPDRRDYLLGSVNIDGTTIGLGAIHPRSASGTQATEARIADHNMVIDFFADYDKAIVAGDFNTYEDRELNVYRDADWSLGNCGYFGYIDTYRPHTRAWYIDNIITKGIQIDNFYKIDNRADVSDHYPVVAKLSLHLQARSEGK